MLAQNGNIGELLGNTVGRKQQAASQENAKAQELQFSSFYSFLRLWLPEGDQ